MLLNFILSEMFEITDEFGSTAKSGKITCFEYVYDARKPIDDILYAGTSSGSILHFPVSKRQRSRTAEFCREHKGSITALLYIRDEKILSGAKDGEGVLVSGSADRSLCILYPHATDHEYLLQKLHGHDGTISALASGKEGSIISASIDGVFKIWLPQKGRDTMKFPYFECTFSSPKSMSYDKVNWLQALAVKSVGVWSLYVGDAEGGIDVYRKGGGPSSETAYSNFTGQVQLKTTFKRVHQRSIGSIHVQEGDKLLISLGYDNTCKVSDCVTGTVIISVSNQSRQCMYRSALYDRNSASFLLVDELGFLTTYSWVQEKVTEEFELMSATPKQANEILMAHRDVILGDIDIISNNFNKLFIHSPRRGAIVMVKKLIRDQEVTFVNDMHDAVVAVAPMATLNSSSAPGGRGVKDRNRFSSSEHLFFTCDKDGIFCFTEFNQEELYQLRNQGRNSSDITFMHVLWDLSSVVTGHDNGTVCLWSTDSASSKIVSRHLKNTVNTVIEATARQSRVLVAADHSGQIAVWNLSFLVKNPTELSLESISEGFHDPEDPSILAMAYHPATKCMISGGSDCTLQMWRLGVDVSATKYDAHSEPVCALEITDNLLISGDLGGVVMLWALTTGAHRAAQGLRRLVVWPSLLGIRAVLSTLLASHELPDAHDLGSSSPVVSRSRVYVAISGVKEITTWCVDVVDRRVHGRMGAAESFLGDTGPLTLPDSPGSPGSGVDVNAELGEKYGMDDDLDYSRDLVTPSVFDGEIPLAEYLATAPEDMEDPAVMLSLSAKESFDIDVQRGGTVNLHGSEPTCVVLSMEPKPTRHGGSSGSASASSKAAHDSSVARSIGPRYLYYGTVEGKSTRYCFA